MSESCPQCTSKELIFEAEGLRVCEVCEFEWDTTQASDSIDEVIDKVAIEPIPKRDLEKVPTSLRLYAQITVHAWYVGPIRGYRFGTICPYPSPSWSKMMTGVEAFQFLNGIKNKNRRGRLEAFTLPPK